MKKQADEDAVREVFERLRNLIYASNRLKLSIEALLPKKLEDDGSTHGILAAL